MAQPGPWASGYQFPTLGDVGSTAGTAPPPPADAPDPSGGGAPPGALPPGPQQTLGDNQQAGQPGPPGQPPPYSGTGTFGPAFQQYLQLTQGAYAPSKRPYLPEQTKPGFLANLFTFGMAGLMDRDYRTAYNAGVDRFNSGLDAKAAHDAMELTGHDAAQQMRLQGIQQQALWRQYEMMRQWYQDQLAQKGFRYKMTAGPPKSEGESVGQNQYEDETGLVRVPSKEFPGRYEYVSPGSRPVGADTPLGQQYDRGGGGGGSAGGGGAPPANAGAPPARPADTGPPPGGGQGGVPSPSPSGAQPSARRPPRSFDELRRQKYEDAANAEVEKGRKVAQAEGTMNGDKIRAYLNDPMWDESLSELPSAKTPISAALKAHANKLWFMAKGETGNDHIEYLRQGQSNIIPQIKAYAASKGVRITMPEIEMFGTAWNRLAEGGITQERAQAFKRMVLRRLDQIDDAAAQRTPSTTSTSTSTGNVTSSSMPSGGQLPSAGRTRSGIQYQFNP